MGIAYFDGSEAEEPGWYVINLPDWYSGKYSDEELSCLSGPHPTKEQAMSTVENLVNEAAWTIVEKLDDVWDDIIKLPKESALAVINTSVRKPIRFALIGDFERKEE